MQETKNAKEEIKAKAPTPFTLNEDGTMTITFSAESVAKMKIIRDTVLESTLHKTMKQAVEELLKDESISAEDGAAIRNTLDEMVDSYGDMVAGLIEMKADDIQRQAELRKVAEELHSELGGLGALFGMLGGLGRRPGRSPLDEIFGRKR